MDMEMEREFCSDFKCCDVKLRDLHELFEHLENCHQESDIGGLPFSGPSLVPASNPYSYHALSDFLPQPSTPPRPSTPPLKTPLFTRRPLPSLPPASPTDSESSSRSSASTSESPSVPSPSTPGSPSPPSSPTWSSTPFLHFSYPSSFTRDQHYSPVAIRPTPRLGPAQEVHPTFSTSAPTSFWPGYPNALGFGYGYYNPATWSAADFPNPALFAATPVTGPAVHALLPLQPHGHANQRIPANAEVIDVDEELLYRSLTPISVVSSPSPTSRVVPLPSESEPLHSPASPLPIPSRLLGVDAPVPKKHRSSLSHGARSRRPFTAMSLRTVRAMASSAYLTSLRKRIFGRVMPRRMGGGRDWDQGRSMSPDAPPMVIADDADVDTDAGDEPLPAEDHIEPNVSELLVLLWLFRNEAKSWGRWTSIIILVQRRMSPMPIQPFLRQRVPNRKYTFTGGKRCMSVQSPAASRHT
ncbi:hypothetical protein B0H10DRAFT_760178 [Mycena sp. CBHHK59/15]|nr:hypothetical protein B0H10DRAFT_760178 [Mycena sp. CBHHK59/15]